VEQRVQAFPGVGPVTANIFLRELRPYWPKADPLPLPAVHAAAASLGLSLDAYERKTLTFIRLEAGLIRYAHRRRRTRPQRGKHQGE